MRLVVLIGLSALVQASNAAFLAPGTKIPSGRTLAPSQWHRKRRAAILEAHPEVSDLLGREALSVPALLAVNAAQLSLAISSSHLPSPLLAPCALLVGGTLSLWQFALLHDVKHGTAVLPGGLSPDRVLFACSMPSVFGYFLYLRYGHLSHHKDFGRESLRTVFDSAEAVFEDGDVLFNAHRQNLPGDTRSHVRWAGKEVGGLGLSISRTVYANLWSPRLGWTYNAAVYSFSMCFERAALCANDKVVAVVGRNFFFPNKPAAFHETCTAYARTNALVHALLFLISGPSALLWLFWAELGWQLPPHPAMAMFVSNHPSLANTFAGEETSTAACQPTASVYVEQWYDWLCAFANFHTEHHDFPDMPMFRLANLRRIAPEFYSAPALVGCDDGIVGTIERTFAKRDFYACAGEDQIQ